MADQFTVRLSERTLRRLAEAARRAGRTPEELASEIVTAAMTDEAPAASGVSEPKLDWDAISQPTPPQTTPEDYDGPHVDLDEALDKFSAQLSRERARRAG
jgi:hypothetical protein